MDTLEEDIIMLTLEKVMAKVGWFCSDQVEMSKCCKQVGQMFRYFRWNIRKTPSGEAESRLEYKPGCWCVELRSTPAVSSQMDGQIQPLRSSGGEQCDTGYIAVLIIIV
jgi:hypothetical protein